MKERGQATVEELAETVDLTQMAVRHHLNVLQGDNLVTAPAVRRNNRRGRPQQVYALTAAADKLFPEDYYQLTDYLLDELLQQMGEDGVETLFTGIADRLVNDAPKPQAGQSFEERLDQVVNFLSEKGFVLRWEHEGDLYRIQAISCPYRKVAHEHGEVCLMDQRIIASMLSVTPHRVTCMAVGDEHCTYQLRETRPISLVIEK